MGTILAQHKTYKNLVDNAFKGDHGFVEAMDRGFIRVVTENEVTRLANNPEKSSQLLSLYCDQFLRRMGRKTKEEKKLNNDRFEVRAGKVVSEFFGV